MSSGKEKRREGGLKKFIRTTFTLILCIACFLLGSRFGGGLGLGTGFGTGKGDNSPNNVIDTKVDKGQEYVDKVTEQGSTATNTPTADIKNEPTPTAAPTAEPTSEPTVAPTPIPAPEKTEFIISFNQTQIVFDDSICDNIDALREVIVANQATGNTLPYVIKMENAYGTVFDNVKDLFEELSKNDPTIKYTVK